MLLTKPPTAVDSDVGVAATVNPAAVDTLACTSSGLEIEFRYAGSALVDGDHLVAARWEKVRLQGGIAFAIHKRRSEIGIPGAKVHHP